MNILVTGGLGFIGSHVVCRLKELFYNPVIIDNLSNSSINVLEKIEKIAGKVDFIKGDIRDEKFLESVFSERKIDVVMHFAALKSVGESQKYPEIYYQVNVNGTKLLLETMKRYGCKKFIYSSSATVYGDSKAPVNEETQTGVGLRCNYAQNKYDIEQYLKNLSGFNTVILRYFNPVGAHESGLIGEDPTGIPNNIFPYLLRVANKTYPYFTVYGNDYPTEDGTCIRDYIHVDDLARAHIEVLPKMDKDLQIYNVGTGKGTSVLELINTLNKVLESHSKDPIKYQIGERREGDVAISYADCDKIYREIGFKTHHNLEKMCEDGLRFAEVIR